MNNIIKTVEKSTEGGEKIDKRFKLSPEEKAISVQAKKNRVKIANMVKRKPEIKKECCICGTIENTEIVHNRYPKDPYIITFICKQCRLNEENLKEAEKHRFDIREVINKSKISAKNFAVEDVKMIVEDYLVDTVSIGKYCENIGISRHQFNQLLRRYTEIYNDASIYKKVINHANKVTRQALSKAGYTRYGFKVEGKN